MSAQEQHTPQERKCCGWCGEPITGPLWKRWCSDACKMKAYRARKARKAQRASVTPNSNAEASGG